MLLMLMRFRPPALAEGHVTGKESHRHRLHRFCVCSDPSVDSELCRSRVVVDVVIPASSSVCIWRVLHRMPTL